MNLRFGMLAAAALLAGSFAQAQGTTGRNLTFQESRSARTTATVKSVDQKTRMVTVVGEDGKPITFKADERVKNLPQVKVGDHVTVDYFESVAIAVNKPGEAGAAPGSSSSVETAPPGEKPAGTATEQETVVANVVKIAPDKKSVTLKTHEGKVETIPVKNPDNLEGVRVGDEVTITATRAVAVAVHPAKAAKGKAPAKQEATPSQ